MRPSPTELQRDADEFDALFEGLPGVMPEVSNEKEEKPKASDKPKAKEPKAEKSEETDDEDEEEKKPKTAKSKAILDDEDEDEDSDDEEEEDDDAGAKAYKDRQKRRELKESLKAAQARNEELEGKLKSAATPAPSGDLFTGPFAQIKKAEDIQQVRDTLTKWEEYLEDRLEGFTDAEGNEWTPQQVREQLRGYKKAQKHADSVDKFFATRDKSAAKAKELYPWVTNTASKRHDIILDIAKDHPEVARSPHSALLLGRLSIAHLVESGDYVLVKKGEVKKAAPTLETKSPPVQRKAVEAREEKQEPKRLQPRDVDSIFNRLAGIGSK